MMAVCCELCARLSPDGSLRCDCGYEGATGDVDASIIVAGRQRREARDKITRGVVAVFVGGLGVLTCGVLLWMHALFAAIPATFVLAALGVAGIGNVIGGTRDHVRAARV